MKGLLLIVFSEEDVANSRKHSSVVGKPREDYLIPLQSLFGSANDLVDVCYLENRLRD